MRRIRFSRWSGTQSPLDAGVDADEVLDEITDDLLEGATPQGALQRLARRGLSGRQGLDALRRRVERARRRELDRMGVAEPLEAIRERLDDIVDRERATTEAVATEDEVADRLAGLDALPDDVAARLAALADHDWMDPGARADYEALVDELRRDVADATFGRLAGALGSASPEQLARMQQMLSDLADLIDADERGEDVDFDDFKRRYGDLLPGDPQSLEELVEELARRMAAASRMLASLSADQRRQLAELAEQALGGLDLADVAGRLQAALQRRHPELGWDQPSDAAAFGPEESGSLSDTVDWMEHLQEHEDLAQQLAQDYPGARLDDIDVDEVRRLLGEDAATDLTALREAERILERAGATRRERGRLTLTPQGVRRLGQRSLRHLYDRHVGLGAGEHRTVDAGGGGEPTGATRPWQLGEPLRLDVGQTVRNAVLRTAGELEATPPVRVTVDDFAIADAERHVRATTVLLLDMSFSMPLRGNWVPAKKVALALHALVTGQFPDDRFHVIGFSDYARRLQPGDLFDAGWERVYGTNMEHAFRLARRALAHDPQARPHVLMVTDGEPTAHLDGDTPVFAWPPEPETLHRTMAEAQRLARTGATLNVFLLDHDPGAARFVEAMVRRVGGRILYPDLADLGRVVVRDFLSARR